MKRRNSMEQLEVVETRAYIDTKTFYKPQLDLDKVETIDDCKKLIKFIYDNRFRPIHKSTSYAGFEKVEEYFDIGDYW